MAPRLRVYTGDDAVIPMPAPTVRVRLGEIYPLLADALQGNRTWLDDFQDDEVRISSDLYELIRAYAHYRPGA